MPIKALFPNNQGEVEIILKEKNQKHREITEAA